MTRKEAIEILKTDGCYECAVEQDSPYNCNDGGCEIREAYYMAIEALEADVKPVVRGEWKRRIVDNGFNADWVCNKCGHRVKTDYVSYNYCPNCGAEMRGDNNDC